MKVKNYIVSRASYSAAIAIAVLMLNIFAPGCSPLTRTQKGAAIGGGAGATVGALIGRAAGNAGLGAIIGGAVGGTAGAYIGSKIQGQANYLKINITGATLKAHGNGMLVKFDTGILFDPGATDLKPDAQTNLKNLASALQSNPSVNILVTGHTDSTEAVGHNMALSVKRAKAVKNFLVADSVRKSRIAISGRGSTEPADGNGVADSAARNRRVEIVLTPSGG